MSLRNGLARALKAARRVSGVAQERLDVTSRTYLSQLERGRQTPTLDKLDAIAGAIGVHPLSLLIYAYSCDRTDLQIVDIQARIKGELAQIRAYDSVKD
ncbi:helix-turn-helix domain-containing protein [Caballeronia sordidicola]|uniref:helix-turn-helix domain-containing protein n=1 Tax=Caballeronia sordidicola TaxID=196367 RepID=UPI000B7749B0|nr:helix-turn-helix transcriptional regulator [Caballeronia sordidicola]